MFTNVKRNLTTLLLKGIIHTNKSLTVHSKELPSWTSVSRTFFSELSVGDEVGAALVNDRHAAQGSRYFGDELRI